MRSINLYFAGSNYPSSPKIKNRLVSYMYPEQFLKWVDLTKNNRGKILLDSGAFSAWNKGDKINIDDYIAYIHSCQKICDSSNKELFVVNLDVIPGKVGETSELNRISNKKGHAIKEGAAEQGLENMKILLSNGIKPIHVFHQGEDLKWLDKMVEYIDYVGISPANDVSNKEKLKWIELVFNYLYSNGMEKIKTHGFAVFGYDVIRKFPWESCDASSPIKLAAWGKIFYPIGGLSNPDFSKQFMILRVSKKREAEGLGDLRPGIIELFKKDGYSVEDLQDRSVRASINMRCILAYQRWVNKWKENHEYSVSKSLLF